MRVNLRKALFVLPNLFTLSSIFCGFYACVLCAQQGAGEGDFNLAALLIVFAAFFDTIDGRVARLTRTQSAFGVQIDSLADVSSFGVAPALLAYSKELYRLDLFGALAAFAFLACGAIRLARFNVLATAQSGAPKKPGKYIVGLPIPGAAGLLVSLLVAMEAVPGVPSDLKVSLTLGAVLLLAGLMVSTLRFRSFKEVRLSRWSVLTVLGVLAGALAAGVVVHPAAATLLLGSSYVVLALFEWAYRLGRANREETPASPSDGPVG